LSVAALGVSPGACATGGGDPARRAELHRAADAAWPQRRAPPRADNRRDRLHRQRAHRALVARGDQVTVLTRDAAKARDLFGPHVRIETDLNDIDRATRIDAVVNLAGRR